MRTLSYANFNRDVPLKCENLVLMCVDFRFRKQVMDLLQYGGYRDFDLVALPGASLSVNKEESREIVYKTIDLVKKLHGIERVIVVDHQDCGTCGGSGVFSDSQKEEQFHADSLRQAAGFIRDRFAGIEVVTLYVDWQQMKTIE